MSLLSIKQKIKNRYILYRPLVVIIAFKRGIAGLLKGKRGCFNHIRSSLSFLVRSPKVFGKPINITIEPTTFCNLHCASCDTGAGLLQRPKAHMSLNNFATIMDKIAPHTNTLMFYFMGEPFANKYAYEMISLAKKRGISFITTCTNGDLVNPEQLVTSGIDEVNFQIGGMTQESHSLYRKGSNLERIMTAIKKTVELRDKYRIKMRIVCGFILMKHNEHEIGQLRETMSKIRVDAAIVIDPIVKSVDQAKMQLPSDKKHWYYNPRALDQGFLASKNPPHNECPWLYYSLTIQVNGDVVPCCRDTQGDHVMGNILREDLKDIWNNEKYRNFRSEILKNQYKISLCKLCSAYGVSILK